MATHSSSERQRQLQYLRELMARTGNPILDGLRNFAGYLVRHPPLAQGGYYVVRGLWPLLGAAFFWSSAEIATFWHAQATGVLILTIGVTLLVAGARHLSQAKAPSPEIWCLALGSALGLAVLELVLVSRREISAVHLLDVVLQGALLFLWGLHWFRRRQQPTQVPSAPPATVSLPDSSAVPPAAS